MALTLIFAIDTTDQTNTNNIKHGKKEPTKSEERGQSQNEKERNERRVNGALQLTSDSFTAPVQTVHNTKPKPTTNQPSHL